MARSRGNRPEMSGFERLHWRCGGSAPRGPFALSSAKRRYERSRPFDITHLALDLRLDLPKKQVLGSATLSVQRVSGRADIFELDAVGFAIHGVELDDGAGLADAVYDYDGDMLRINIPRDLTKVDVRISYTATPERGLYFLAPDSEVPDRAEQVWSQCQDEDGRYWFPCHDKPHVKMTTELRVVVPAGMTALSNGDLIFHDTPQTGDSWVYHFKLDKPHPSYLITLAVGRFDVIADRDARVGDRSIAVTYLVPPGKKAEAKRSLGETPRMIELFSRLTGVDYPFSRYSQVVVSDFIFGGMENTTATTLYEHVLLDERAALDVSSHDLVAHELAHQWFGDLVTCRDWSHGWLNEGFATFFEHIEREDRLGLDEYEHGVDRDLAAYISEAGSRYQRPVVCREYEAPIDLFDRHLYEKGGLVLHMLRRELGDAVFWRGVGDYLRAHAYGIAETMNFQRALEQVSGQSLDQFFDQWLHRPGHPTLRVKLQWDEDKLHVSLKQTQKTGDTAVFCFPLEVAVADSTGNVRHFEKLVRDKSDALTIALDERPAWVAVDPHFRVAADWTLDAPADWLRKCLMDAEPARVRIQAARALSRRQDAPTIAALGAALANEAQAWMVRGHAARALGKIRGDSALDALLACAETEHPKVRRAVASALGNFREGRAAKALSRSAKKDISYLVQAESSRALGRTRHKNAAKVLPPLLERSSWADVTRAGVLDGLSALRDEDQLETVERYTRYGVPARGRRAAISAMARLSDSRKTRQQLEDLLEDRDPHLRMDVVAALETLGDPKARGALSRCLARELDGRVVRRIREALRELGTKSSTEHKRLSDELETVRGELSELKVRLSKLEGPKKSKKDKPPRLDKKSKRRRRRREAAKAAQAAQATTPKARPKKATPKKVAKKTSPKKAAPKKAAPKKATAQKATAKKVSAKKATAKKVTAKKTTPRPARAKKATAKRATPKQGAKKATPKKRETKRAAVAESRDKTSAAKAKARRSGAKKPIADAARSKLATTGKSATKKRAPARKPRRGATSPAAKAQRRTAAAKTVKTKAKAKKPTQRRGSQAKHASKPKKTPRSKR